MPSSATGVGMPICLLGGVLLILTQKNSQKFGDVLGIMIKGWMRPDMLPSKISGKLSKQEWFDYFKSISYEHNLAGNYKVSAGLFKSFEYMECYYLNSLKKL